MAINYSPAFLADPAKHDLFERRVKLAYTQRRPFRTIMAQSQAIGAYNVLDDLRTLPASLPVLVIHGTEDKAVYFSEQQRILDRVAHAEVARLPSADYGHFWCVSRPTRCRIEPAQV